MKYYEVTFTLTPCSQDAQDILAAMAAEAGFETFEETADGLVGYVQQQLFDADVLEGVLNGFPLEGTHIIYKVSEAEDRDWNAEWEQEGFEPIIVEAANDGNCRESDKTGDCPTGACRSIVIHDGRHLPDATLLAKSAVIPIEIDAHLAFGTGTHETTRMMCGGLLSLDLHDRQVLDCGCGTGILGISALKLGAAGCTAYDIDEWSADNTRHNAVINHVDDHITVLHGDATLLDSMATGFDVVMANINRNILLADMERFVSVMAPEAVLLLSGFYENDCAMLESKAQSLGLVLTGRRADGEWACLTFRRM